MPTCIFQRFPNNWHSGVIQRLPLKPACLCLTGFWRGGKRTKTGVVGVTASSNGQVFEQHAFKGHPEARNRNNWVAISGRFRYSQLRALPVSAKYYGKYSCRNKVIASPVDKPRLHIISFQALFLCNVNPQHQGCTFLPACCGAAGRSTEI